MQVCNELRNKLADFVAERLPERDLARLEDHVNGCSACAQLLERELHTPLVELLSHELWAQAEAAPDRYRQIRIHFPTDKKTKEWKAAHVKVLDGSAARPKEERKKRQPGVGRAAWGSAAALLLFTTLLSGVQLGRLSAVAARPETPKGLAIAEVPTMLPSDPMQRTQLLEALRKTDPIFQAERQQLAAWEERLRREQKVLANRSAELNEREQKAEQWSREQTTRQKQLNTREEKLATDRLALLREKAHEEFRWADAVVGLAGHGSARALAEEEKLQSLRERHLAIIQQLLPPMERLLSEESPAARLEGMSLLTDTGLAKELAGSKELSHWEEAETLRKLLRDATRDPNGLIRLSAAQGLWALDRRSLRDATQLFHEALRHRDSGIRQKAILVLETIGREDRAALPLLAGAIEDPEGDFPKNLPVADALCASLITLAQRGELDGVSADSYGGKLLFDVFRQAMNRGEEADRERVIISLRSLGIECRPPSLALTALPFPDLVRPAVSLLAESLAKQTPLLRKRIADALGDIGQEASSAAPALTAALEQSDPGGRVTAAGALARVGSVRYEAPLAVLRKALREDDADIRKEAAASLRAWGPLAKGAVATLVERLADHTESRVVQRFSLQALKAIGPGAKGALPILLARLKAGEALDRDLAAECVAAIGPEARSAEGDLHELLEKLDKRDSELRIVLARALWGVNPENAPKTVAALVEILDDPKDKATLPSTLSAMAVLGEIGPEAKAAIPSLVSRLRQDAPENWSAAAVALGAIGPAAKEAVPVLAYGLWSRQPEVRVAAARALWQVEPNGKEDVAPVQDLLSSLSITLCSPAPVARAGSAAVLEKMGPVAQPVVPILFNRLGDPSPEVRSAVGRALARIAPQTLEGFEQRGRRE
jgi:Skp family chaperone for outer membrane proteins